jgi:hypothetical protein
MVHCMTHGQLLTDFLSFTSSIPGSVVYSHQLVVGFSGSLFTEGGLIKFAVRASLSQISRPKMILNLKTKNFYRTVKPIWNLQEPD